MQLLWCLLLLALHSAHDCQLLEPSCESPPDISVAILRTCDQLYALLDLHFCH